MDFRHFYFFLLFAKKKYTPKLKLKLFFVPLHRQSGQTILFDTRSLIYCYNNR